MSVPGERGSGSAYLLVYLQTMGISLRYLYGNSKGGLHVERRYQMIRLFPIFVICCFLTGCLSFQRTLDQSKATSIKKIAIIPVEPPPFYFNGSQSEQAALTSDTMGSTALINAPVKSIRVGSGILTVISGIATVINAESGLDQPPGNTAKLEQIKADLWMPTSRIFQICTF